VPLVFPGSGRKKTDEPLDPFELTFRDGRRTVTPLVADLMSGMDTVRFTYAQALERANQRVAQDHVQTLYSGIVSAHFKESRR